MTEYEQRSDGYTAVEDQYAGYTVVDESGSKIGKVDDLFLDENDQPEYFGVKMGFLGTSSTLIPADIATIDNDRGFIEVSQTKDAVKEGPAFDDDREITPEYENEVRSYYGLGAVDSTEDRGTYGDYDREHSGAGTTDSESAGTVGSGMSMGDTETGEFREHERNQEGLSQPGSDLEDELRVQRSEEELVAGTREREAGSVKVRKRVRNYRERVEVPTRHEEVSVERVPVSGEATEAQIGADEVFVPVVEDEVVVQKKPVTKEEIRVRKDVVHERQIVEEDVRREEVEIEDDTRRRRG
ncbi:MAG: PRC and DUF2382 domain-containing protein [Actinomycetota bacterium]|nr:PRC and DUF2382 domain-containing protein [Actinomycetota bacterium]